jgi:hypothetical protein
MLRFISFLSKHTCIDVKDKDSVHKLVQIHVHPKRIQEAGKMQTGPRTDEIEASPIVRRLGLHPEFL